MGAAARARRPEDVLPLLRARRTLPQGWCASVPLFFLLLSPIVSSPDQLSGGKSVWLTEAANSIVLITVIVLGVLLYHWIISFWYTVSALIRVLCDIGLVNFEQAAQILGKPDLAPMAWVKRLVTLCDRAPATPYDVVRDVVEKQFGKNFDDIFEFFDVEPVGSASIAQVRA